jgi:hypothetical protein
LALTRQTPEPVASKGDSHGSDTRHWFVFDLSHH